jgi:hypothetical protein
VVPALESLATRQGFSPGPAFGPRERAPAATWSRPWRAWPRARASRPTGHSARVSARLRAPPEARCGTLARCAQPGRCARVDVAALATRRWSGTRRRGRR